LENLSNLGLLKIIKLTKTPSDNLSTDDVIGIGDYRLLKNTPLQISIEPLNRKKPSFEFKVVKDETTLALKLLNNEVDLSVASISPRKINWIKENSKNLKTYELPSGNYMFLGLNQNRSQFKDINIRKALSYLIPRQDLLKYKLKGSVALSNGMFSTAFPKMHTDRLIDEYNPTIATQLLNKAGYKKNKNGWLEKDGREFEIDWKVSNNKSSIEMVEVIKYYFSKVGIRVNITVLEWGTYMSNFKSGKFDIVAGQWIGFNGPDMLRFVFHSENIPPKGGNRIRYSNSNFDKVIDLATQESNPDKSILLYKEAEKIVSDDYAYVNLWHPNVVWIGRNCLKNVEVESTGSFNQLPKMEIACE
jgi:peptide/nickel transport system substrate-binding protein